MEEFVSQLKEKIIRRIEEKSHIAEKKAIVEEYCFSFPFLSPDDFKDYIGEEEKPLGFKEELQSIFKTPKQVETEKNEQSVKTGESVAEKDFEYIKREIRMKASSGEYETQGDKRIIRYKLLVPGGEFSAFIEKSGYMYSGGVPIESGVKCVVEDELLFNTYKTKLKSLAEKDGIFVEIKCVFEEDGNMTYFDVPGKLGLDNRTYAHLGRRTDIFLIGYCEF